MHKQLNDNPKMLSRMEKWNRMITKYIEDYDPFKACAKGKSKKFYNRVFKGPPVAYRWRAWLARFSTDNKLDFSGYATVPLASNSDNEIIRKDLDRTFPD